MQEKVIDKLADLDPWGLVASGAPRDEYTPEAPEITALLLEGGLTRETLKDVFARWFGELPASDQELDDMVEALVALI